MAQRPASLVLAVRLVLLLAAVALVMVVLAVVLDDELVAASGMAGASADDTRVPPSFTPVVAVLYVTVVSLVLVLVAFVLAGHNWARHCLAAAHLVLAIGGVAGLRTMPSPPYVVVIAGSLVVEALVVFFLYRPDTSAYLLPDTVGAGPGGRPGT